MSLGGDLGVRLDDFLVGADDIGDPGGCARPGRVARPVDHPDGAIHVAEQGKGIPELLREGGVLLHPVEGNAQDRNVLFLVFGEEVAEPATLGGSARSIRHRIEPEDDGLSPVVREAPDRPRMVFHFEFRGRVTDLEHLSPLLPQEHA